MNEGQVVSTDCRISVQNYYWDYNWDSNGHRRQGEGARPGPHGVVLGEPPAQALAERQRVDAAPRAHVPTHLPHALGGRCGGTGPGKLLLLQGGPAGELLVVGEVTYVVGGGDGMGWDGFFINTGGATIDCFPAMRHVFPPCAMSHLLLGSDRPLSKTTLENRAKWRFQQALDFHLLFRE